MCSGLKQIIYCKIKVRLYRSRFSHLSHTCVMEQMCFYFNWSFSTHILLLCMCKCNLKHNYIDCVLDSECCKNAGNLHSTLCQNASCGDIDRRLKLLPLRCSVTVLLTLRLLFGHGVSLKDIDQNHFFFESVFENVDYLSIPFVSMSAQPWCHQTKAGRTIHHYGQSSAPRCLNMSWMQHHHIHTNTAHAST